MKSRPHQDQTCRCPACVAYDGRFDGVVAEWKRVAEEILTEARDAGVPCDGQMVSLSPVLMEDDVKGEDLGAEFE